MTAGHHRNPYLSFSHSSPHWPPRTRDLSAQELGVFSITHHWGSGIKENSPHLLWAHSGPGPEPSTLPALPHSVFMRTQKAGTQVTRCAQTWKLRFGGASDTWAPKTHDLPCWLPADGTELIPAPAEAPTSTPAWAFVKSIFALFLPSKRLGNRQSPESCSSCSKLNYIHQPGASTIVPRAFPALIRIFLFSLGEGGQPSSASVTLPGARTWNCRAQRQRLAGD